MIKTKAYTTLNVNIQKQEISYQENNFDYQDENIAFPNITYEKIKRESTSGSRRMINKKMDYIWHLN